MIVKQAVKHKALSEEKMPSDEQLLIDNAGDLGFCWLDAIKEFLK